MIQILIVLWEFLMIVLGFLAIIFLMCVWGYGLHSFVQALSGV